MSLTITEHTSKWMIEKYLNKDGRWFNKDGIEILFFGMTRFGKQRVATSDPIDETEKSDYFHDVTVDAKDKDILRVSYISPVVDELDLSYNHLMELAVPYGLRELDCSDNDLYDLKLSETIKRLRCFNNKDLEEITIPPKSLRLIECDNKLKVHGLFDIQAKDPYLCTEKRVGSGQNLAFKDDFFLKDYVAPNYCEARTDRLCR